MPIYRGTQKVAAVYRGSQEIVAAYRGTSKVWSSGPPFIPFTLSGTIAAKALTRYSNTTVASSPSFSERGVFKIEMGVTWQSVSAGTQKITYTGYTINGPSDFDTNPIAKDHDLRYPPYTVSFQAFSNSATASQRNVQSGWWKITRIAM